MKQEITIEQWNELSPMGSRRLGDWWDKNVEKTNVMFPYMNIGMMIEFLEDHKKYVRCEQWIDDEWHHWRVGLNWLGEGKFDYICEQKELVDALWMAVKEELKK